MKKISHCTLPLLAVLALGAGTGAPAVSAQVATLRVPADEAVRDPSLVQYRGELGRAIRYRDSTALYRLISPNIKLDFGGAAGLAEFKRRWRPDRANGRIWTLLDETTSYNGRFQGQMYVAPWMFVSFPERLDASQHAVVRHRATVRARPDARSPVLAQVGRVVLPVVNWTPVRDRQAGTNRTWIQVRLKDGRRGYVVGSNLYNPLGHRALFEKVNGRWQMVALVAGD